jgi:hypothetical protein
METNLQANCTSDISTNGFPNSATFEESFCASNISTNS